MRHLDDLLFQSMKRDPSRVPAEVWTHLETGCETCVDFLAAREAVDGFDGAADRLLLAGAQPRTALPSVEAVLARTQGTPWVRVVGSMAALALMVVGVSVAYAPAAHRGPQGLQGDKGVHDVLVFDAHLAPVGAAKSLAVRLSSSQPAFLSVVALEDGRREVLLTNHAITSGTTDLEENGVPVGIPSDPSGKRRVALVASPGPLDPAQLDAALRPDQPLGPSQAPGVVVREFSLDASPSR